MQPSAETADFRRCPACGTALPADAPMGLCVPCLLGSCVNETGGRFGDYELLGLGKEGGMGVVYRARQISLDRIVALKMIRGAFLTPPAQVQRFRAEAAAAARLDHPHIVPIYEIGEHEGRLYFAMKWMEGGSLADQMPNGDAESGPPSSGGADEASAKDETFPGRSEGGHSFHPRSAAGLMVTISRAVHHAHQRGIIHRDLKPSNILLDSKGEPHVTDFGLAKRLSQSERETGTAELTLSGDTLGTPAYMAPEQAAGNARDVTTAADVYSLGAILYQLLAGQPPFTGGTPLEILRKVVEEEPKPPMRLKSEIRDSKSEWNPNSEIRMAGARGPARASGFGFLSALRFRLSDLDLICLKCLEKDPAGRYHSAEALADDLENWLAHKPISVRPRSAWGRFAKWCRRKPAIAGLSALVLVTALAGFAAVLWKQRQAERARQQAVHNLHKAIEVVTNYLEIVANNPRLRSPGLYPLQKELLQTAELVLEDFARQHSKDPDVLRRRADAYRTLARMQERHGLRGEALASITAARVILESLVAGGKSDGMLLELARVSREAGRLLWLYDRPSESESAYHRALDLTEQLTRAAPDTADHRRLWASTRTEFAKFLRDAGRLIEAQALVRAAVDALQSLVATSPASFEDTRELVMALLQHDGELTALSEPTPARAADLTRAVELARNLVGAREPALQDRVNLASALSALGECQHRIGNMAAAEPSLRESVATWDRLKEEWPTELKMQFGQARARERLSRLLTATGHDFEAAQVWQKSEDILTRHLGWYPFDVVTRFQLIGAYREKARSCLRVGDSDQSRHWLEKALALHDWLMANAPEFSTHQASLAATQHELATVLRELGQPDRARELLEAAVGHYQSAVAKKTNHVLWKSQLAATRSELERLRLLSP